MRHRILIRPRSGLPAATPVTDTTHCPEIQARELQRLTADISSRLQRVCDHLPDDEFAELVIDIARVRMRYEQRMFGHRAGTLTRGAA